MTRANERSLAARLPRPGERLQHKKKKKPYKIVLEHVTQEKKKLRSIISYEATAPTGYTFVPAGAPELTTRCKELCRKRGLDVHVVSAAPKNKAFTNPEKIAHHVHRIGHHFPNDVVDLACEWEGYTIQHGQFRKSRHGVDQSKLAKSLQSHSSKESREQVRLAIRDLFPKIPKKDLDNIVKHAFRNGTTRVGNAAELSLPRRVQLAVVAHIRHEYTDYDKLLKQVTYLDARSMVEPTTLERLMKWRGENDTGKKELEEMFREVIVLDDEDEGEEDSASDGHPDHRHESVEIRSSPIRPHDLRWDEVDNGEWVPHPRSLKHGGTYLVRAPDPMRLPLAPYPPTSFHPEPRPYAAHQLVSTRPERISLPEAPRPPRLVYAAPPPEPSVYRPIPAPERLPSRYVEATPRRRLEDAYGRPLHPIPPPVRALPISEAHVEPHRPPPSRYYVERRPTQKSVPGLPSANLTYRNPIAASSQPAQYPRRQSPPRPVRDEDIALPSIEDPAPQKDQVGSDPRGHPARTDQVLARAPVEPYDPHQPLPEARVAPRQQPDITIRSMAHPPVKRKSWHDAYAHDEAHDASKRVRPDFYADAQHGAPPAGIPHRRTPPRTVDLTYSSPNRPRSPYHDPGRVPVTHDPSRPVPFAVDSPGSSTLPAESRRRLAFPPESSIQSQSYRRGESPHFAAAERSVYSSRPRFLHRSEQAASELSHREIFRAKPIDRAGYPYPPSHPHQGLSGSMPLEDVRRHAGNSANAIPAWRLESHRPAYPADARPRYHEPLGHRPERHYAQ